MAWYSIGFDGEGLAFARITRHDRHGQVYMLVGKPVADARGKMYPTKSRLQGFRRVKREEIASILHKQYGNAVFDGPDQISVAIQSDRLWADALTHLQVFESLFGPPHIQVVEGFVTAFVESKSDLSEAAIHGRMQGAAPRADVKRLESFDATPWQGLAATMAT